MNDKKVTPNNIQKIRTEKELSLQDLAQKVGTTAPSIKKLESGDMKITIGTPKSWANRIADALDVSVFDLFNDKQIYTNQGIKLLYRAGVFHADTTLPKKEQFEFKVRRKHPAPEVSYYAIEVFNHTPYIVDSSEIICTSLRDQKMIAKECYHICLPSRTALEKYNINAAGSSEHGNEGFVHLIVSLELAGSGELVFKCLMDDAGIKPIPCALDTQEYSIIGKTETIIRPFTTIHA